MSFDFTATISRSAAHVFIIKFLEPPSNRVVQQGEFIGSVLPDFRPSGDRRHINRSVSAPGQFVLKGEEQNEK